MFVLVGQVLAKKTCLWLFYENEIRRSFHPLDTVQDEVRESDLVSLWDGTARRRSLAEHELLEGAFICTSEFRYIGAVPVVVL